METRTNEILFLLWWHQSGDDGQRQWPQRKLNQARNMCQERKFLFCSVLRWNLEKAQTALNPRRCWGRLWVAGFSAFISQVFDYRCSHHTHSLPSCVLLVWCGVCTRTECHRYVGGKEQFSGADPVFLLWNPGIKLSFLFVWVFFFFRFSPSTFTCWDIKSAQDLSFIERLTIPVVLFIYLF